MAAKHYVLPRDWAVVYSLICCHVVQPHQHVFGPHGGAVQRFRPIQQGIGHVAPARLTVWARRWSSPTPCFTLCANDFLCPASLPARLRGHRRRLLQLPLAAKAAWRLLLLRNLACACRKRNEAAATRRKYAGLRRKRLREVRSGCTPRVSYGFLPDHRHAT